MKCLIWTNHKALAEVLAATLKASGRKYVVKYDPTIGMGTYKVYQTNQLPRYAHVTLDELEAFLKGHS